MLIKATLSNARHPEYSLSANANTFHPYGNFTTLFGGTRMLPCPGCAYVTAANAGKEIS